MIVRQQKTLVEIIRELKSPKPGRAWAHALREREQRGDNLTNAQRAMWRAALNADGPIFAQPITNDAEANDRRNELQRQADTHRGNQ